VVSAFMSNTAGTAFFVPLVIGYARKIGASPSQFLLPLAFAPILTSSVTLISTSTNLVVSDLLTNYRQPPMGMFELASVGIPITILGLVYILTIGVRLIPRREDQKSEEKIGDRRYQADVVIVDDGPLGGKSLKDAKIVSDIGGSRRARVRSSSACHGISGLPLGPLKNRTGRPLMLPTCRGPLRPGPENSCKTMLVSLCLERTSMPKPKRVALYLRVSPQLRQSEAAAIM
jgi:hypothetical protein